ncbi:hypothetical protein PMIT1342_01786 [Prochlorococcus marinus str. MIT 1342]|nr:hypothetical protein PMIT1342_01786 [Prochlorococcus marinus str. MIT 1342]
MQFGWKAIATSVNQQSTNAYLDDMGLTTATEPDSTMATDRSPADISWENLDGLSYCTQTLAADATDKASHNLLGHRDQHSLINFKVLAVTAQPADREQSTGSGKSHQGPNNLALHRPFSSRDGA